MDGWMRDVIHQYVSQSVSQSVSHHSLTDNCAGTESFGPPVRSSAIASGSEGLSAEEAVGPVDRVVAEAGVGGVAAQRILEYPDTEIFPRKSRPTRYIVQPSFLDSIQLAVTHRPKDYTTIRYIPDDDDDDDDDDDEVVVALHRYCYSHHHHHHHHHHHRRGHKIYRSYHANGLEPLAAEQI